MNFVDIDHTTFAETITSERCRILTTIEAPGTSNTYVAVLDGIDVLIVTDILTGGAIVVTDSDQDHESGGGIHDHARLSI